MNDLRSDVADMLVLATNLSAGYLRNRNLINTITSDMISASNAGQTLVYETVTDDQYLFVQSWFGTRGFEVGVVAPASTGLKKIFLSWAV